MATKQKTLTPKTQALIRESGDYETVLFDLGNTYTDYQTLKEMAEYSHAFGYWLIALRSPPYAVKFPVHNADYHDISGRYILIDDSDFEREQTR